MALKAHTNAVGSYDKWEAFKQEWRGADGSYFSNTETVNMSWSRKPGPLAPAWIKGADGTALFKKPTSYYRHVGKRTNPQFTEQVYWDPGKTSFRATVTGYMQNRLSNTPVLLYMPGAMENPASDDPVMDSNVYNRLLIEAYNELREVKLALGNAMAEAVTTVDMIADTAKTLAELLYAAKHGRWKYFARVAGIRDPKTALKLPSNLFLQWKYGWKPLMSDIRDGVELLKENPITLPLYHVKKYSGTRPEWEFRTGAVNGYNTVKGKGRNATTLELWVTMDPTSWNSTFHSLGLDNPLGILWEVTPYSFVVDWLVPVGDYLSALAAMPGLNLVGGYVSYRGQGSSTVTYTSTDPVTIGSYPTVQVDRFGFRRIALTSLPVPLPYVKSPFSNSHTQSALALLAQLIK